MSTEKPTSNQSDFLLKMIITETSANKKYKIATPEEYRELAKIVRTISLKQYKFFLREIYNKSYSEVYKWLESSGLKPKVNCK